MKTRNLIFCLLQIGLIAAVSAPWNVFAEVSADARGPELHKISSGETLSDVAKQFLGGEEFVPELLEFNNITNPTSVGEGTYIALPGPIRDQALAGLRRAKARIEDAREAKAETYAPTEFQRSVKTLESAREARYKAAYAKSQAQADIAEVLAIQAVKIANKNANVSKDGRISVVKGVVEISEDAGGNWKPAYAGMVLPISAVVRTSADARAEVVLEDGSVLLITEGSEISIRQYLEDMRSRDVNIELEVLIGNMLGKIKPKTGASKMKIKTPRAAIAIRGTTLRARADINKTVFTEVLEGAVDVFADGKTLHVGGKEGLVARPDRPPQAAIPLLPAPLPTYPSSPVHATAVQLINFAWEPLPKKNLARYQFEIAEDEAFTLIVDNQLVADAQTRSVVLPEGDYFWRVTGIDTHGLIGLPSTPGRLVVRKNTDISLVYKGELFAFQGENTSGPKNEYLGRAAQDDSSVTRIEYSINGAPWSTHDRPLNPDQDGEYEIRMRGVAADGDTGPVQSLSVSVDATPPKVTIDVRAPFRNPDGTESVEARLDAFDNTEVARIEYRVGEGPFGEYAGPFALSAYHDYTIDYRAQDRAGNTSPTLSLEISGEIAPRGIIQ